jgi:elongation factor Tu
MRAPDVEAEITFLPTAEGGRTTPALSGYRPNHKIKTDYLTSGVHYYYDREEVAPGETALGTITFITPEAYPHSLRVGQEIEIQEGARVYGRAKITKIFNPLLEKDAP